jgi:hypothetical protein
MGNCHREVGPSTSPLTVRQTENYGRKLLHSNECMPSVPSLSFSGRLEKSAFIRIGLEVKKGSVQAIQVRIHASVDFPIEVFSFVRNEFVIEMKAFSIASVVQ